MTKKFKTVTLGCRTNQYESQAYTDQLKNLGYSVASDSEAADLCIVNTCTVTESADSSSRHKIRALLRANPNAKVVVTGCLVENAAKDLAEIDPRLQIVSNLQKENLIAEVFPGVEDLPEFKIEQFEAHTRAFVKVQDGCNSFCTYCVIPYVRGRSRSKPLDQVLNEVRDLVANGFKEIVLTGINIGDYDGEDGSSRLCDLIQAVDQIEGLERIRVSSIDPDEVDQDLLNAIIHSKKTCPSMHIVLQAGSNAVLKRMNRKYTKQMFLDTYKRLKQHNPDFTLTTDIIVGFPGETEGDFQETLEIVEQVKFAKVHMFPYSRRPRTRAALYKNTVPDAVIKQRKEKLLRLAEKTAFDLRGQYIGKTMKVLLESTEEANGEYISGHTENFLRVSIPKQGHCANDIVEVHLTHNTPEGLRGEVVSCALV